MISKFHEGVITFDESTKEELLSCFGKTVDDEGYIIERDTGQKVVTQEGDRISIEEFAGIRKGSEIYLKSDLPSLIKLLDTIR
jgi:hypothetical protein